MCKICLYGNIPVLTKYTTLIVEQGEINAKQHICIKGKGDECREILIYAKLYRGKWYVKLSYRNGNTTLV